jgi:hypothetical protein
MNIFASEYRTKLINSLPNHLRDNVRQIEENIREADNEKFDGAITDPQLANFFTLIYIAMAKSPNRMSPPDDLDL